MWNMWNRYLVPLLAHEDKMDREVYVKLIRSYSKYAKRDIHALYEIASRRGIDKEVKALMEVVYE